MPAPGRALSHLNEHATSAFGAKRTRNASVREVPLDELEERVKTEAEELGLSQPGLQGPCSM